MIEIFTTNIQNEMEAEELLKTFKNSLPELKVNFDINEIKLPYPCGHSILRAEGKLIHSEEIISILNKSGFMCDILEDKICN